VAHHLGRLTGVFGVSILLLCAGSAFADSSAGNQEGAGEFCDQIGTLLPTGQRITPLAAPNSVVS